MLRSPGVPMARRRMDSHGWAAALAALAYGRTRGDVWLDPEQLAQLSATGLGHRLVHAVPQEAIAEGWRTQVGDATADATAGTDETLAVEHAMVDALAAANTYGGSWLWPVTGAPLSAPLDPGHHEIEEIRVVTAREATPSAWVTDRDARGWGRPEFLSLSMIRGGASLSATVHHTHLVYVPGAPKIADLEMPYLHGYDLSWLQLYWRAISRVEGGADALGLTLERRGMPVIKMSEAARSGNPKEAVILRLEMLREFVDKMKMLVVGSVDDVTWANVPMGGSAEVWASLAQMISAVQGAPLTKLLGVAPAGLSTDDKAGERAWNAILAGEQRKATRILQQLYDIQRGPEPGRRIVWAPLGQPDGETQARTSLLLAQRDEVLIRSEAIMPGEARERYRGEVESIAPVLDDAYDIDPADELAKPEPEPPLAFPLNPAPHAAPPVEPEPADGEADPGP